jgi:inorganic pyrophosphatase
MNFQKLTPGPNPPKEVYALIEIPKGSRNKYEVEKESGFLMLDRVLYSSVVYPGDYGIIPKTYWDDGDPLDILVLTRFATFPGCLIKARPVALLEMIDTGDKDDKILAVPIDDPYFQDIKDLKDLSEALLNEIAHFFKVYKELQPGKWIKIKKWWPRSRAEKAILRSIKLYQKAFHEA